jgi:hypothetical protein
MKQFVIDGNKVVLSQSSVETRVEDFEFQENEVYGVDIVMSTGEGKVRQMLTKTECCLSEIRTPFAAQASGREADSCVQEGAGSGVQPQDEGLARRVF